MKFLKSCLLVSLALVLALAPLTGCNRNKGGDPPPESTFTPVLRFVVGSDFHTRDNADNDYNSRQQVQDYITSAYAYSEAQSDYNKLDGIFFVGDITQGGTDREFADFFSIVNTYVKTGTIARAVLGNHEFYATKVDDGTNSDIRYSDTSVANTNARFKEYGGYEAVDAHLEIGGYHFIFLSMDRYDKSKDNFFTDAKLTWLEAEIKKAVQADSTGTKPIFVFQHEPPMNTMYGSVHTSADEDLTKVFAKYPQVVDFSGHTHYPITDPRAIWQGTFTALTTGGMAYLGIPIAGSEKDESLVVATNGTGSWTLDGDLESYIRNAFMYYVVEVDASNNVRISVMDARTGEAWGEPWVFTVGNRDKFVYTDKRADVSVAPTWPQGAALTVTGNSYKNIKIAIPQAECKDVVQNYRVDVFTKAGTLIHTSYVLACTYYGKTTPKVVYATVTGLKAGTEYACSVTPVNSWGDGGTALRTNFTTPQSLTTLANPTPDILQTVFYENGSASNAVTNDSLTTWGAPTVSYDAGVGGNVATFDGVDDAYGMAGMGEWYGAIGKSFTLEMYVCLNAKPSSGYINPFSNQQSGGFGFEYKSDGKMYLYANVGETSSNRPRVAVQTGRWLHLVGTYDGTTLKLYLNGQLVASAACADAMKRPQGDSEYLVVGGDSAPGGTAGCFANCTIAAANLYSEPLTATQIANLYQAYP